MQLKKCPCKPASSTEAENNEKDNEEPEEPAAIPAKSGKRSRDTQNQDSESQNKRPHGSGKGGGGKGNTGGGGKGNPGGKGGGDLPRLIQDASQRKAHNDRQHHNNASTCPLRTLPPFPRALSQDTWKHLQDRKSTLRTT
eukprot:15446210-Alexandrium_andersonii.AAC.1